MRIQKRRIVTPNNMMTALIGFLFLVSLSVVLVLNMRWIYRNDVQSMNLPEMTGYSEEVILENYDVLIDYNLITAGIDVLEFPDFPMSEQGRIHFEEVKQIFVAMQYGCIVTGILFLILLIRQIRRKAYGCLVLTSIFSLVIPSVIGIMAVLFWDKVFVLFHRIFFRNDYWLFDPVADPIINILPDVFFFHCAAAIVLMIIAGSLICFGGYLLFSSWTTRSRADIIERNVI